MAASPDLNSARREYVLQSYNSACAENHLRFLKGDDKATAEYIFPNQIEDANNIVGMFYNNKRRVISIQKKTKVGADGLMIEIAKLMTTHPDDAFMVNNDNVRFMTGMANVSWEKDMIDKAPTCQKDKIFHHGKLSKADLMSMRNGLIIVDEIDTGDKEYQVLHNTLKEAGVLDVRHMEEHNNRFVFISATMIKELYELYRWGDLHELYKMTIPPSYIGHKDFLELGIIEEFYPLTTTENAERWVQEDILDNYGDDYRVHLVRVTPKTVDIVQNACIRKGVIFRNHTSTDRLSDDEIKEFFKEPLKGHIVLGIKGFFRRANLIPNSWKLRIGATHELYTKKVDNNVQIQGLPGRMSGYWRDTIEGGHKTGPHRTSIRAIEEYERTYEDPFGKNTYHTSGFVKRKGKVTAAPTMLSPKNIKNIDIIDLPEIDIHSDYDISTIYNTENDLRKYMESIIYKGKISSYELIDNTISYRGKRIHLYDYVSEKDFKKKDIYSGLSKTAINSVVVCRIMPVISLGIVKYISIYLKSAIIPKKKKIRFVIEPDSEDDRPANGGAGRSDSD
jgi:hypothetical protein